MTEQELQAKYEALDKEIGKDVEAMRKHLHQYHVICMKLYDENKQLRAELKNKKRRTSHSKKDMFTDLATKIVKK